MFVVEERVWVGGVQYLIFRWPVIVVIIFDYLV
jgi:hypothetical protein